MKKTQPTHIKWSDIWQVCIIFQDWLVEQRGLKLKFQYFWVLADCEWKLWVCFFFFKWQSLFDWEGLGILGSSLVLCSEELIIYMQLKLRWEESVQVTTTFPPPPWDANWGIHSYTNQTLVGLAFTVQKLWVAKAELSFFLLNFN